MAEWGENTPLLAMCVAIKSTNSDQKFQSNLLAASLLSRVLVIGEDVLLGPVYDLMKGEEGERGGEDSTSVEDFLSETKHLSGLSSLSSSPLVRINHMARLIWNILTGIREVRRQDITARRAGVLSFKTPNILQYGQNDFKSMYNGPI